MASLLKYSARINSNGRKLFWDRAHIDGLPFRGDQAPMMNEDEFDAKTSSVVDFRNAFFDTAIPAENQKYLDVVECCLNGWFRCVHLERFWQGTTKHYIEWAEYYLEDGTRTPFSTNGVVDPINGNHLAAAAGQG